MKPTSENIIDTTNRFGARNYLPLPVVISKAEGVWVFDPEGRRYLDMLSAYSALNQGHRHPRIIRALKDQADCVTLTSRAFHNDRLGEFYERLSDYTGKAVILPMNTGAEAVETAIKAARRWAYTQKNIPDNQAEILVCEDNFHGRTITVTSCSSNAEYKHGFGPFTPGFTVIPYGDANALEQAISPRTAAFLVEPIQGEAGVVLPPPGYLRQAADICKQREVLLLADEIQTGFGRTGYRFACDAESVEPDVYILGKALGGGVLPVSAVAANREVLELFEPGSHGSTFGGNPLACAVATAALQVVLDEKLAERSLELGDYFLGLLRQLTHPLIRDIRGRGLFIGLELATPARAYCEKLMSKGILCKETHDNVIRLAPPLTISTSELDWAYERIAEVLG
ncbi:MULTISPECIES: ornithine--oxo-acid transaminase [unclassified Paenibacillus]|uniref:ornithine--oxo-acid transaminase n=1 Tax=unclassified Paenibacillus TaxID=185978 RepID=UPI001AE9A987|nr:MULTISPECIES: ornithine--oxo-acid transaminase [unclassified Paenibacillus]MBP1156173.1 ornithine--oxo-acid transaminase [Paenibacillus sp. PvP091]MBP1168441.1 ornithine--oxo-acid transaminase [Paenibacillus sp. PvR098]MBP2439469.1 ornithine--oxo-acid transaminase [Paenibacillus sp. PvP052]